MSIIDDMMNARRGALIEGNPVQRWKFSPKGWDEFRFRAELNMLTFDMETSHIKTVLGLPYTVTCDLPPETLFSPVLKHGTDAVKFDLPQ